MPSYNPIEKEYYNLEIEHTKLCNYNSKIVKNIYDIFVEHFPEITYTDPIQALEHINKKLQESYGKRSKYNR